MNTALQLEQIQHKASQVMLGNSIFAAGDLKAMGPALGKAGFDWVVASIDNEGVRRFD